MDNHKKKHPKGHTEIVQSQQIEQTIEWMLHAVHGYPVETVWIKPRDSI